MGRFYHLLFAIVGLQQTTALSPYVRRLRDHVGLQMAAYRGYLELDYGAVILTFGS